MIDEFMLNRLRHYLCRTGLRIANVPPRMSFRLLVLGCLLFLFTGQAMTASAKAPPVFDANRLNWSQLKYKASKLGVSVFSDIELTPVPASEVTHKLIQPDGGTGFPPEGSASFYLTLRTKAFGRDMRTMLWFNPENARALQRARHEVGSKRNEYKAYRFTKEGTMTVRKKPLNEEKTLPHEEWSNVFREFTPSIPENETGLVVTDPSALFYIVSVAQLSEPGEQVSIPVFIRGRLALVELTVEKSDKRKVNFVVESPDKRNKVNGPVDVLEISVRSYPLAGNYDDGKIQLAGLEEDITFLVDKKTRLPLELSGKTKFLGTVRFELQRASLKEAVAALSLAN